jgi:predicted DNA binding CopG/RHH family protein
MSESRSLKRKRINMRIPEDLIEWAKSHVLENNTNLTQDYIDYLTDKRKKSEKRAPPNG